METGGCPHTAIREDASMNLAAVDNLSDRFSDLDLIFIESGGDNLSATFRPELAVLTTLVLDVAEGDKMPRTLGLWELGTAPEPVDKGAGSTRAAVAPGLTPAI